jgi:pimeloyl-ACP methyl ester carboxylesterase
MSQLIPTTGQPTVVLVHGAFADSSSWTGVIERLQAEGIAVTAPPNPLRGLDADVAYLTDYLTQTPGPVVAVGHSYGGAVISDAANRASNVSGLVFVAAFAPDEGEVLGQVSATSKDSILMTALVAHQYPTSDGTAVEFFVDPTKFRDVFAADLPTEQAAVLAGTQRPVAAAAFADIVQDARVAGHPLVGDRGHRRQGGRHRSRPLHGRTRGRDDHRGRCIAPGARVAPGRRH